MTATPDATASIFALTGSAGGLFRDRASAEIAIAHDKITGCLTEYPLGIGFYDWAIAHGLFRIAKNHQRSPEFIARFSCAAANHSHYDNGVLAASADTNGRIPTTIPAPAAITSLWVFMGRKAIFPAGIFHDFASAGSWVAHAHLTGVLAPYPVGQCFPAWITNATDAARYLDARTNRAPTCRSYEAGILTATVA